MRILTLDFAIKTGWAIGAAGRLVGSGVQVFDLKRGESPGMRFLRMNAWLAEVGALAEPTLVLYELAHHRGGAATELAVGFQTRAQEWAASHGIEHAGVHTATLKKFATGSGRGEKPAMIAAAARFFGVTPRDDNEADALCLLQHGFETYGEARRASGT